VKVAFHVCDRDNATRFTFCSGVSYTRACSHFEATYIGVDLAGILG